MENMKLYVEEIQKFPNLKPLSSCSIFGWMSNFSSSMLNFRLDVSFFGQLSQFSSRCPTFFQPSQFSSDVSFFVRLHHLKHPAEN
ncbi:hypothetical protein V9T40_008291 [Parthenolecanium corni]|uniref:Uncharacterized protein n=1 Tax=Parthenolecanium corni TaxID=536013 RepID=A0AAN9TQB0_9HEMI